jgi:hypothetical protein
MRDNYRNRPSGSNGLLLVATLRYFLGIAERRRTSRCVMLEVSWVAYQQETRAIHSVKCGFAEARDS